MKIEVVTLFPEMIRQALTHGVVGRALRRGLLSVGVEDPRVAYQRCRTARWMTVPMAAVRAW